MMTQPTTAQLKEMQFINGSVPESMIDQNKTNLIDQYIEKAESMPSHELVEALNNSPLFNNDDNDKFTFINGDILVNGEYNHVINANLASYLNDWLCTEELEYIEREYNHLHQK